MTSLTSLATIPGTLNWELRNQFGVVAVVVERGRVRAGVCVAEHKVRALVTLDAAELDSLIATLIEARSVLRSDSR